MGETPITQEHAQQIGLYGKISLVEVHTCANELELVFGLVVQPHPVAQANVDESAFSICRINKRQDVVQIDHP